MPKSAKKRKDKAADFSKAKLKLGKEKKAASNAIDTSFKARSIALPQQSITINKDESAPTTRRKLSLENLISHLKHYNPGTRKDALLGFRELLDEHRELIEPSLTEILSACARVIADDDTTVRKALYTFMSWFLPLLSPEILLPHSQLLLLFTTSAQTHIFPEIRVDAVKFLGLLLTYIPDAVVSGWCEDNGGHGARILEGYLGLLSAGTKFGDSEGPAKATSTASVVLTPVSKLVVFESLASFLGHALSSPDTRDYSPTSPLPIWFFESSFASPSSFDTFNGLIDPHVLRPNRTWRSEEDFQDEADQFIHQYPILQEGLRYDSELNTLSDILTVPSLEEDPQSGVQDSLTQLAQSLHATLVATYLDSAPTVFSLSGNPGETELKLVVVVCEICKHIYGTLLRSSRPLRDDVTQGLSSLLGYMAPHFPFVAHGARDIKIEQVYQDLNLIYCELSSLLFLSSRQLMPAPGRRKGKRRVSSSLDTDRVSQYMSQVLKGEASTNSNVSTLARSLTPAQYIALLPTIWTLLNSEATERDDLFVSLLEHATNIGSKSPVKKFTVEFIGRLVLLGSFPQYHGRFQAEKSDALATWVEHLPRTLWELGGHNVKCSETILRVLLRLCQRRSPVLSGDLGTAICARLAPFFFVSHPKKGELLGPWSSLPSLLRRLALDLVQVLLTDAGAHQALDTAITHALMMNAVEDERNYWIGIRQGLY